MKDKKQYIEIVGKKVGMTQLFDQSNKLIPVTLIEAEPCFVSALKTLEKDGYNAVQLACFSENDKKLTRSLKGHLKNAGIGSGFSTFFEFRVASVEGFELSQSLSVEEFSEGELVDVIGKSKGKGFQGVVKRFNFAGGKQSHGSMSHRRGGSYGQCQWPGEVNKGKKMPGRMGGVKETVQNLAVMKVIPEKNIIILKGSCPGHNGSVLRIRRAVKAKN